MVGWVVGLLLCGYFGKLISGIIKLCARDRKLGWSVNG